MLISSGIDKQRNGSQPTLYFITEYENYMRSYILEEDRLKQERVD